jgi:hypothetical protein
VIRVAGSLFFNTSSVTAASLNVTAAGVVHICDRSFINTTGRGAPLDGELLTSNGLLGAGGGHSGTGGSSCSLDGVKGGGSHSPAASKEALTAWGLAFGFGTVYDPFEFGGSVISAVINPTASPFIRGGGRIRIFAGESEGTKEA